MENKNKVIMVERETYKSKTDGKSYFAYFIKGSARGKEFKIGVIPPDRGGYTVLDIVFGELTQVELVVTPFEIKDNNGKVVSGNTYSVRSYDEDGQVYECKIKPKNTSDKNLLEMILR